MSEVTVEVIVAAIAEHGMEEATKLYGEHELFASAVEAAQGTEAPVEA